MVLINIRILSLLFTKKVYNPALVKVKVGNVIELESTSVLSGLLHFPVTSVCRVTLRLKTLTPAEFVCGYSTA